VERREKDGSGGGGGGGKERNLSLVDVYDIAADIGKEFEELIDLHGPDQVTQLMQKVISALEQLEVLVQRNDSELLMIEELRRTIEHLEHEDNKKTEERHKYARDIEQVEEHFKLETKDYLTTIKRLQEENRKLSSSLTAATERDSGVSEDESYIEIDLVHKLQGTVEKQREQIRDLDSELSNVKADLEELKGQNDRLSTSNKELRRKLRQSQNQLHCLVDERAELQVTLQDQQRETSLLAKRLGLAAKENQDLAECATAEPDMKGKVVYEVDDPNRPRFTLMELKDILQERNTLKARVSDLEDELELYRPSTKIQCSGPSPRTALLRLQEGDNAVGCDCAFHSGREHQDLLPPEGWQTESQWQGLPPSRDSDSEDSSERPVQGPMPYEPEDAPWKRSESSGIRKFFRRVFGATSSSPQCVETESAESAGEYQESINAWTFSNLLANQAY